MDREGGLFFLQCGFAQLVQPLSLFHEGFKIGVDRDAKKSMLERRPGRSSHYNTLCAS
jgi:hypothetical protein